MASSSSSSSLHTNRKLLQLPPPNYSNTTSSSDDNNNDPTVQTCLNYCKSQEKNTTNSQPNLGFCPQVCLAICPSLCHYSTSLPSSPNNFTLTQPNKPYNNHHSPLLITMLILLATTFLLTTFYILYTKLYFHFYAPNSNSFLQTRTRRINNNNNNNNNFSDDYGHHRTVVFHPFWYISSVGLPATAIRKIAVVKYTKEMEENNDCAVCLAEFEIGESLRVLPKCSHFFHIVCIDTWLSSHTNCPLCRAPIFNPDHHGDDHHDHNLTVDDGSSSVEVTAEDNSLGGDNNLSTREEEGDNNDNLEVNCNVLRRVNNNKGSFSQRWSLERGASNLLSRSLSCSGKIFSSRCCNNNNNNNINSPS